MKDKIHLTIHLKFKKLVKKKEEKLVISFDQNPNVISLNRWQETLKPFRMVHTGVISKNQNEFHVEYGQFIVYYKNGINRIMITKTFYTFFLNWIINSDVCI